MGREVLETARLRLREMGSADLDFLASLLGDVVETEVGYLVARRCWRRGFASEAAAACRDYAFGRLGRQHVISLIRPENLKSQGVARKMGMVPERTIEWRGFTHTVFGIRRPPACGA